MVVFGFLVIFLGFGELRILVEDFFDFIGFEEIVAFGEFFFFD